MGSIATQHKLQFSVCLLSDSTHSHYFSNTVNNKLIISVMIEITNIYRSRKEKKKRKQNEKD